MRVRGDVEPAVMSLILEQIIYHNIGARKYGTDTISASAIGCETRVPIVEANCVTGYLV